MRLGKLLLIGLLLLPAMPALADCEHGCMRVAILKSDYTLHWFINGPAYHPGEPWGEVEFNKYWGGWDKFLNDIGIKHIIISDSDIERGRLSGIKLIILPNVAAMSEKEDNAIKDFVRDGGSVIATFGTSWLDERGKIWDGGRFALWQLWGIPVTKEFGMFVPSIYIAKLSPVTSGIAIGADVAYGANANTLETKEPILPRASIVAFLVDSSGSVTDHAAIVERGLRGKVVYFSFSPEYVYSLGWADTDMKLLMSNALTYCLRR
jgi:hypothetical protein